MRFGNPAFRLRVDSSAGFTMGKGGAVDAVAQFLGAGGLDYALFDFRKTDRLWQEAFGPTPADDNGEVIGLAISTEKQGSKTLAVVMAAQPELRGNGTTGLAGAATPATYNAGTGAGTVTRVDGSNQSYVVLPLSGTGRLVRLDIEVTGFPGINVRQGTAGASLVQPINGRFVYYLGSGGSNALSLYLNGASGTSTFTVHSCKVVPSHFASQATASFKPQLQAAGTKFDGSDDNLLSDWRAQAGANCIIARVTVPASLSATQVITGTQAAGSTSRFWLGVNPSSGRLICGVGANGSMGGVSADIRNSDVVVALTCDGSTVKLYQDGAEVYSAAQSGSPTTAVASCIGCLNSGGIPFSHFGGAIRALAFGNVAPPLADIQKVTNQFKALA